MDAEASALLIALAAPLVTAGEDMPEVSRLVRAPKEDKTEAILKMMLAFSYASECCEIGFEVNASRLKRSIGIRMGKGR